MIILPTVRGVVFPPLTNLIGSGSFGEVFGPFRNKDIHNFLAAFYKGRPIRLRDDSMYVIKKVAPHEGKACPDLVKRHKRYFHALEPLSRHHRSLFILPIIVGCIGDTMFEIQKFGGKEVFDVLRSADRLADPSLFMRSLVDIMDACLRLVDKGILLTDLKPENMVMTPDSSVSVIDFDVKTLNDKKRFLFTPDQDIVPIQFMNLVVQNERKAYMDRYLSTARSDKNSLLDILASSKDISAIIIAKFSIVWCIAHIIHLALQQNVRAFAPEFMSGVMTPIIRQRMTVPVNIYAKWIRDFITTHFRPDGRTKKQSQP